RLLPRPAPVPHGFYIGRKPRLLPPCIGCNNQCQNNQKSKAACHHDNPWTSSTGALEPTARLDLTTQSFAGLLCDCRQRRIASSEITNFKSQISNLKFEISDRNQHRPSSPHRATCNDFPSALFIRSRLCIMNSFPSFGPAMGRMAIEQRNCRNGSDQHCPG